MKPDLEFSTKCFNLKATLECGQCFRWNYVEDNTYIGVIYDRVIKIKQEKDKIFVWSNKKEKLKEEVFNYFDLYTNYEEVEKRIAKIDENISKSLNYSTGIHILNQPLFETIISYIISANNNIKRISRSVNTLSQMYGKKIEFEGNSYYLFPTLEEFQNATMDKLLEAGTGFRARYIKHDIEEFLKDEKILNNLENLDTEELRKELLSFMGIGPKVADCIMLFSLQRNEVFPTDVWVKRIMEKLYFKKNTSLKEISKYATQNFKNDSGIVQQHLFYNVREGNI